MGDRGENDGDEVTGDHCSHQCPEGGDSGIGITGVYQQIPPGQHNGDQFHAVDEPMQCHCGQS